MARPPIHGMSYSRTYTSWHAMRNRCNNPVAANYALYGGRGIAICPEWDSFEQFWADMGTRPAGKSIDRIDNEAGYSKDNCRWATASEQQQNKRHFKQPEGRTYGEARCSDCGSIFVRMNGRAIRCVPCLAYSRRYHAT